MEIVSPEAFLAAPVDKAVLEEGFAVSLWGDRLACKVLWGRLEPRDVELSFRFFDAVLAVEGPPLDVLFDARAVAVGNQPWAQFAQMFGAARARRPVTDRRVARVATIAAQHIGGHALAGAHLVLGGAYEARAFRRLEEACAWFEPPDAASLVAWIEGVPAAARARSPLIQALHAALATAPAQSVEAVAAALDQPVRQLQRALSRLGTTFKDEQRAASMRVAQALLAEPGRSLEEVARAAGFRSTAQLVRTHRAVIGRPPRE